MYRIFTLFLLFPILAQAQPACTQANYNGIYILNANDYPYTSGSSGITVSASAPGVSTLSNFSYTCSGLVYNTAAPAWWLNSSSQTITLTFSCPVTNFSVTVNGTNTNEEFYFNAATGSVSLSNYCAAGFVTGAPNSLICTYTSGATSTLISVDNPVGSTTYYLTHNGVGSGSRIALLDCFTCTVILPADILSFQADYLLDQAKTSLKWESAFENDCEGYHVQHSTDLQNWEDLTFVDAAGGPNKAASYTFDHNNPLAGDHYYRLMQEDVNGNQSFSEIHHIRIDEEPGKLTVYPNPSEGVFEVLTGGISGRLIVRDVVGRIVLETDVDHYARIDLSGEERGMYLLELQGDKQERIIEKIILN